jgi:hypothetical protein
VDSRIASGIRPIRRMKSLKLVCLVVILRRKRGENDTMKWARGLFDNSAAITRQCIQSEYRS